MCSFRFKTYLLATARPASKSTLRGQRVGNNDGHSGPTAESSESSCGWQASPVRGELVCCVCSSKAGSPLEVLCADASLQSCSVSTLCSAPEVAITLMRTLLLKIQISLYSSQGRLLCLLALIDVYPKLIRSKCKVVQQPCLRWSDLSERHL